MRRTLSVLLLIVLLNVASATQNQYNNPPQYVQRPSDGGDYPNGEPSATQRQMQQTEAQFAAPIPQQPAVYGMQQPMQPYGAMQQQQQRPPPGYQSPYGMYISID